MFDLLRSILGMQIEDRTSGSTCLDYPLALQPPLPHSPVQQDSALPLERSMIRGRGHAVKSFIGGATNDALSSLVCPFAMSSKP